MSRDVDIQDPAQWMELQARVERAEQRVAALAQELREEQESNRALVRKLEIVKTPRADVWQWQGDGHDEPGSLTCPVVMSAETLSELVGEHRLLDLVRDEVSGFESGPELYVRRNKVTGHYTGWDSIVDAVLADDEKYEPSRHYVAFGEVRLARAEAFEDGRKEGRGTIVTMATEPATAAKTDPPPDLKPGDPCPRCGDALKGHAEIPWYCTRCSYNPAVRSIPGHCTGLVWLAKRGGRLVPVDQKDLGNLRGIPCPCVLPEGHPPPCSREPTTFKLPLTPEVREVGVHVGEALAAMSRAVEKMPVFTAPPSPPTLQEIAADFNRVFAKNLDRITERIVGAIVTSREPAPAPNVPVGVQEVYDALEGRIHRDGDDMIDAIRFACEEYVLAENELPDRYDREDYLFSKAVGWMRGDLEEAEKQRDTLRKLVAKARWYVAKHIEQRPALVDSHNLLAAIDEALRNS